jgi:hypothetical protein
MEAQENIGAEVSEKLALYSDNGSTVGSVNFPEVALPQHEGSHRLLHIHRNVPGVMSGINAVFFRQRAEYFCPNAADQSGDWLRGDRHRCGT